MTTFFYWFCFAGMAGICVGMFIASYRNRSQETATESVARQAGLAVSGAVDAGIRSRNRTIAMYRAAVAFIVFAAGFVFVGAIGKFEPLSNLFPLALFWFGYQLGDAIGSVVGTIAAPLAPVRIARSRAPRRSDYVPALAHVTAVVSPVVAIATAVATVAHIGTLRVPVGDHPPLQAAIAAVYEVGSLVPLSIVVALVGAVLVLRHAQNASNESELAWEDAFRARSLLSLSLAVSIASGYLAAASLFSVLWTSIPTRHNSGFFTDPFTWIPCGATVAIFSLACAAAVRKPYRYFLTRLWPGIVREAAAASSTAAIPEGVSGS